MILQYNDGAVVAQGVKALSNGSEGWQFKPQFSQVATVGPSRPLTLP